MESRRFFVCINHVKASLLNGFFQHVRKQYKFSGVWFVLYCFKIKNMPSNDYISIDSHFSLISNIDKWSCPTCSYDNISTTYPTCQMCYQVDSQRIHDSFISDSSEQIWKCPSCAWKNNTNYVFCESCYHAKPPSVNIYLWKLIKTNKYYSLDV